MSDSSEYSGEAEVALDEADQNDDADIADEADEAGEDDIDTEEADPVVYGPLKSLAIRDSNHLIYRILDPAQRKTSNVIQLHEATEAVGIRASQIERGSRVFTDVKNLKCPIKMAWKEFIDRQNPLILERVVEERPEAGYNIVEHWPVREMTYFGTANFSELM